MMARARAPECRLAFRTNPVQAPGCRTAAHCGIALALLPPSAMASRFATATFEGAEYFVLLIALTGYAMLTHVLMLMALFRHHWPTLIHLVIGVVSPFLLLAAWPKSRAEYMLSTELWVLWATAGILLVPLLIAPPLLQWFGYLEGNPQRTLRQAWLMVGAIYAAGGILLGWGATH